MQPDLTAAVTYVSEHLAAGVPAEQIRAHFLNYGWTEAHVNQVFAAVAANQSIVTSSQPALQTITEASDQQNPVVSSQPNKYTIRQSLKDSYRAIASNAQSYVLSMVASFGMFMISYLLLIMLVISLFFNRIFGQPNFNFSPTYLVGSVIVSLLLYILVYASSGTVFVALNCQVLADGLRQKTTQLWPLFKSLPKRLPHIMFVSLAVSFVAILPYFLFQILALITLFSLRSASTSGTNYFILSFIGGFISIIWLIVFSLRAALTTQVAYFEPGMSLFATLKRSSHLLQQGGQWFIVKGILLLVIPVVILSNLVKHDSASLPVTLLFAVIYLVCQAALTMLYFNRVAVRGSQ